MSHPTYYATQALRYTRRILGTLPSNFLAQRTLTLGGSTDCVTAIRARYNPNWGSDRIMNIRRIAGAAKSRRCGNCGEYAAVAFDFLMHTHCPFPLEYASYIDPGDHDFVIINRNPSTDVSRPSTWGPNTVICDPWAGQVVMSNRYWREMPGFPQRVHRPFVYVRWHSLGDFPQHSSGHHAA